jgi:hypothetical protein
MLSSTPQAMNFVQHNTGTRFMSCFCRYGETISLNYAHQLACCSSPRYMSTKSHGGMILTGKTELRG